MQESRGRFEPLGIRARWELLYELFSGKEPGDVVTFAEMAAALDLDEVQDRGKVMGAFPRAAKELLETNLHALESVRGVGYRVAEPQEHLGLAAKHRVRATRALAKGHAKVTHVDVSKLDPNTRAAFEAVGRGFELQMQFNRRTQERMADMERLMGQLSDNDGRSEAEIADLQRRLERLERLQSGHGEASRG